VFINVHHVTFHVTSLLLQLTLNTHTHTQTDLVLWIIII